MAITGFSRLITRLADQEPDHAAITCSSHSITRRELDQSTNQLARAYRALGVNAGDRVTVALPNSIEFMQASIALWKLGATPQPVSARLPPKELHSIITLAKPALALGIDQVITRCCCIASRLNPIGKSQALHWKIRRPPSGKPQPPVALPENPN